MGNFLQKKKKILPLWLKGSLLMAFLALGIKGKPLISAFATFGYRAVNLFQLISHPCLPASAFLDPAETRQSRMPSLQQTTCSLQWCQLLLPRPYLHWQDALLLINPLVAPQVWSSSLQGTSPCLLPLTRSYFFLGPLCGCHEGWNPSCRLLGVDNLKTERIVLGHGFRGIQTCSTFWHYSMALSPTGSTLQTQADPPNSHRVLSKFTMLYWAAIQYVIASYDIASLGCTCPVSCGLGMPSGE